MVGAMEMGFGSAILKLIECSGSKIATNQQSSFVLSERRIDDVFFHHSQLNVQFPVECVFFLIRTLFSINISNSIDSTSAQLHVDSTLSSERRRKSSMCNALAKQATSYFEP